jgi:hypothetical protein
LQIQLGSTGIRPALTGKKERKEYIKMMKQTILRTSRDMFAILLASSVVLTGAQTTPTQAVAPTKTSTPAARPAPVQQRSQANRLSPRAEMYYESAWGVSDLRVKVAESGQLIRFNYRVLNPDRAVALNDKKVEPQLLDPQAGVKLSIPQMEKVGKLRQSSTPKTGMTYWMAFSNPTLAVKRGHRVDVVIGSFRATNLIVE